MHNYILQFEPRPKTCYFEFHLKELYVRSKKDNIPILNGASVIFILLLSLSLSPLPKSVFLSR